MTSSTSTSFSKGFTMIELMVSVGIMVAVSSLIVFNQSTYTSGAELRNLANNLSLSLREAQVYGISVRELSTFTNDFNVGYGVEFDTTVARGDSNSYVFFADRGTPKNNMYDDGWYCPIGGGSECLDKVTLSKGNTVSTLCSINQSGTVACGADRLDIVFVRPATEAHIVVNGDTGGSSSLRGACAELASSDGKKNSVVVYVTGQISVRTKACNPL